MTNAVPSIRVVSELHDQIKVISLEKAADRVDQQCEVKRILIFVKRIRTNKAQIASASCYQTARCCIE